MGSQVYRTTGQLGSLTSTQHRNSSDSVCPTFERKLGAPNECDDVVNSSESVCRTSCVKMYLAKMTNPNFRQASENRNCINIFGSVNVWGQHLVAFQASWVCQPTDFASIEFECVDTILCSQTLETSSPPGHCRFVVRVNYSCIGSSPPMFTLAIKRLIKIPTCRKALLPTKK